MVRETDGSLPHTRIQPSCRETCNTPSTSTMPACLGSEERRGTEAAVAAQPSEPRPLIAATRPPAPCTLTPLLVQPAARSRLPVLWTSRAGSYTCCGHCHCSHHPPGQSSSSRTLRKNSQWAVAYSMFDAALSGRSQELAYALAEVGDNSASSLCCRCQTGEHTVSVSSIQNGVSIAPLEHKRATYVEVIPVFVQKYSPSLLGSLAALTC